MGSRGRIGGWCLLLVLLWQVACLSSWSDPGLAEARRAAAYGTAFGMDSYWTLAFPWMVNQQGDYPSAGVFDARAVIETPLLRIALAAAIDERATRSDAALRWLLGQCRNELCCVVVLYGSTAAFQAGAKATLEQGPLVVSPWESAVPEQAVEIPDERVGSFYCAVLFFHFRCSTLTPGLPFVLRLALSTGDTAFPIDPARLDHTLWQ